MKRFVVIIIILGSFNSLFAGVSMPDTLRVLYFEEWVGKCGAEKLVAYTEGMNIDASPVLQAYRGAALATTSNCTSWPLKKLSRFGEGKALIEKAVASAPQDLEVRFLRYTIQKNIPEFLGYNHVEEDRKFILERLNLQLKSGQRDNLANRIINYLTVTGDPVLEQVRLPESAMNDN